MNGFMFITCTLSYMQQLILQNTSNFGKNLIEHLHPQHNQRECQLHLNLYHSNNRLIICKANNIQFKNAEYIPEKRDYIYVV